MADQAWTDEFLQQSAATMHRFATDPALRAVLVAMADRITAALREGNKLLIAGNGGSAGDAQHIAAEFTGRLLFDRAPLAAIALTTDSSALTALGNDYGFPHIFERQLRALGRPGDVFLGISTSGRSPNILAAFTAARAAGVVTFGFCGATREPMDAHTDLLFAAPASQNVYIQQIHITAAHLICGLVERAMFPDQAT